MVSRRCLRKAALATVPCLLLMHQLYAIASPHAVGSSLSSDLYALSDDEQLFLGVDMSTQSLKCTILGARKVKFTPCSVNPNIAS